MHIVLRILYIYKIKLALKLMIIIDMMRLIGLMTFDMS
ncbi:protein of unknown function [Mesotoga infera]|uniref:Uncharacterized protein n=1 Tax=Mesotoga infera TaxID=1236046 RepID=A0A7Z7LES5_9BACT|nr:protein of unknown function [Mesotoga infera]